MFATTLIALAGAAMQTPADPVVVEGRRKTAGHGFGYADLAEGRDQDAVRDIEQNGAADAADPARLINLGIAHARLGNTEQARALFERVRAMGDASRLETAGGEWIAPRQIAIRALRELNAGNFAERAQMAAR